MRVRTIHSSLTAADEAGVTRLFLRRGWTCVMLLSFTLPGYSQTPPEERIRALEEEIQVLKGLMILQQERLEAIEAAGRTPTESAQKAQNPQPNVPEPPLPAQEVHAGEPTTVADAREANGNRTSPTAALVSESANVPSDPQEVQSASPRSELL